MDILHLQADACHRQISDAQWPRGLDFLKLLRCALTQANLSLYQGTSNCHHKQPVQKNVGVTHTPPPDKNKVTYLFCP